ncbi:hypothetical protein BSK66_25915 [Paenibacillus odorifer]|uniref:Helix-turn-helix domain-containing protein n=1 Tax=Paenibacillus odorifer TaxID=189426 RepID=A0A1R0X1C4_9BACL|nr:MULTISPECIES: helix-turn-helix domain-containing protein [Paenibacillus]ETT61878.1 hypothetical protein C171_11551 [Paenibacillus sp. FSL H8-237]OMD26538.1 hypothetical protein BJP51_26770 [Paenibacillus odorifer]OME49957.1 hypothetical protein BSK66_25915 [Paenibacillus odorifer]
MNGKEAARMLGVHYKTVLNMINDGRLKAKKNEFGEWVISPEDVTNMEKKIGENEFMALQMIAATNTMTELLDKQIKNEQSYIVKYSRILSSNDNREQFNVDLSQLEKHIKDYRSSVEAAAVIRQLTNGVLDSSINTIEGEGGN